MKKGSIFAAMLSMSILLSACGSASPATSDGTPSTNSNSNIIKIASQTPLSGENAEMGEDIKLGIELAIKENKEKFEKMGFDIQLLPKDDKADPTTGITNAQALVTDPDVLAVVGHLNSGVMAAAGTTYEIAGLTTVAPAATNPQLSQNGWKTFHRICGRDDQQGPAAAQFIVEKGKKKVAIIDDSTDYGKGLGMEVERKGKELGLDILFHESVSPQEMEFNTLVTKVQASGAEAVYFGGMYAQAGQFLKQLKDKKFSGIFVSADGANNEGFIKAAGVENVKSAFITSVVGDINHSPAGTAWVNKYKKEFGKEPGAFGVYGYDATLVVLHGLEQAIKKNGGKKPSREQVNAVISSTKDFKGVLTEISFDENGENTASRGYIKSFEKGTYPPQQIAEIK